MHMPGAQTDKPLILFYTRYFAKNADLRSIDPGIPAHFTNDRRLIEKADAVVFHLPNKKEFGDARKYPGQLWVLWSQESSQNLPMMRDPTFLRNFDLRMTYETDADVWAPYLPKREQWLGTRRAEVKPKASDAPVVMFQSSGFNLSRREEFVSELARHVGLHSYGRFLNNRSVEGPDLGIVTKLETIARYPFCIAFENSICDDYVTEKLFEPLLVGSVPLYLGASNAARFAPPGSFIDVTKFAGPKQLADYLKHLLQNPGEYEAYFQWRTRPFTAEFERYLDVVDTEPFLRLADLVRNRVTDRDTIGAGSRFPFGVATYLGTKRRRWTGRFRPR